MRRHSLCLATFLMASMLLAGCSRSAPVPGVVPFRSQAALLPDAKSQDPTRGTPEAGVSQRGPMAPKTSPSILELASSLKAGLVNDLPAMASQLTAPSYQLQVIPRNSQENADRIAKDWAADARQVYVIWAYWKLPALSITRHAYYSPSKGKALKVEFTLASFVSKTFEEPADGFEQAFLILNEPQDRHAHGVKDAHAIARRAGYVPSKFGAAVLLDIKTFGPMWVFADMPSKTEGQPVMAVNAESGMVTQGGEVMMLAKILFKRAGY